MNSGWLDLANEVARWRSEGRRVEFWWRDDDACRPTAALRRLLELAGDAQVPLALAVIPQDFDSACLETGKSAAYLMQHGADHCNRAAIGQKKTEFPASEPVAQALVRLHLGRERVESAASGHALQVLVPPWNRISSPLLIDALAGAGYKGLSRFGPRHSRLAAPGLVQVNTHLDIIDWRGARGFAGEELLLSQAVQHLRAKREGQVDPAEPTGWLTHHAVHDEASWEFLRRLLLTTLDWESVGWVRPEFDSLPSSILGS